MPTEKLHDLIGAVLRAVDSEKLERELLAVLSPQVAPVESPAKAPSKLVEQLSMGDLLDDSILSARAGDKSYPLRVFFATLGSSLTEGAYEDTAFPLACAFGLYFRVTMDEEAKMRVGLEASRLYYRFAAASSLDGRAQISPLLASLMNTELGNLRFESADHQTVFDSQLHERARGASAQSARILAPESFLCRVGAQGLVRVRAEVRT